MSAKESTPQVDLMCQCGHRWSAHLIPFGCSGYRGQGCDCKGFREELESDPPLAPSELSFPDIAEIADVVKAGIKADDLARKQTAETLAELGRRVECFEGANKDMADWADSVERSLAEMDRAIKLIAKHAGLKPAPGPEEPEAL